MQKIYFHQKPNHRERQTDTIKFASKYFEVFSPLKNSNSNNLIIENNKSSLYKFIAFIVGKLPLLNIRKLPIISANADFIYTWGDIPLLSKKPFIIELDNPYVLTFYNYFAFKLYKIFIKFILLSKKCIAITCISESCRNTLISELGNEIGKKTFVLYPRLKSKKTNIYNGNTIKYLFVGFGGKGKGLFELLEAFSNIKNNTITLDIIGYKNLKTESLYKNDKRINFLGQISRDKILDKMSIYDILVFPTYFESFGMVALEGLSRGLGIITTNVYALPEIVKDGYNGKIIKNPYLKENKKGYVEVVKMTSNVFYKKYLKTDLNKSFSIQIEKAIIEGITECKKWKSNSTKIYEEKFSEKAWEKSFLSIFK